MVKRFVVFAYSDYYPEGGWHDFVDSFDTAEEAQQCEKEQYRNGRDHTQIVDLTTGKVYE